MVRLKTIFSLLLMVVTYTMVSKCSSQAQAEDQTSKLSAEIIEEVAKFKKKNYPIDLQTVLHLVEANNLQIEQSQVATKSAKNLLRQRQVALLPDIQGTYVQSRLNGGTQVTGGRPITVVRPTVQPQLAVNWTLYPGGTQIFDILAAKRLQKASEFALKETYQEQLVGAATEFYKLQAAQAERQVALKSREEAQVQLAQSQAFFEVGRATKLDVMRAKTLIAQQQQALIQAENAITQAEGNLLSRLNLEPEIHLTTVPESSEKRTLVPLDASLEDLLQEVLKTNPGLKRLDEERASLQQEFRSVFSVLVPAVTLRAFVGATGPAWGDLTQNDFIGLTATADLLRSLGLEIPFQLQAKKLEIQRKELEKKQLIRDLQNSFSTQFLNSLNYLKAMEAAQAETETAQEALRLAQKRYQEGYSTSLEVATAQIDLARAQNNLVQAIYNYNSSQVQLLQSLGRATPQSLISGVKL